MVLREVPATITIIVSCSCAWIKRYHTHMRSRPFWLTCPLMGLSSPVKSLILDKQIFNQSCLSNSNDSTHSVDFPAPLGPTTAMRESRPTSMLMSFSKILSGVYPNEASFNCSTGGEIFSVSGNLNVSVSSTSGGCSSGSCERHT